MRQAVTNKRRATVLLMVVGLLSMLFVVLSAYIFVVRFDGMTLRSVQKGAEGEAILGSVHDLILADIARQWADADGGYLGRGTVGYADIVGGRASAYLAASEPVRSPEPGPYWGTSVQLNAPWNALGTVRYPAVSQFGGSGTDQSVLALMRNYWTASPDRFNASDVLANARQPFNDALGIGMPNASLSASRQLTELANALAGRPVTVPVDSPQTIFDTLRAEGAAWSNYAETARYEVTASVQSNGGKVTLGAGRATDPTAWFVRNMFWWLSDGQPLQPGLTGYDENRTYEELAAASLAIEPYLRNRGGLLPSSDWSPRPADADQPRRVPAVLAALEAPRPTNRVYSVFVPWGTTSRRTTTNTAVEPWQRFNLADANELNTWAATAAIDSHGYNTADDGAAAVALPYSKRQLLTGVNTSDDVARKQGPDPQYEVSGGVAVPKNDATGMGLFPGQLKFYLGDVRYAFNVDGTYNTTTGPVIIRRLADYYYDMLAGHGAWLEEDYSGAGSEISSRRVQAFMLAVNTVAFAAPYDSVTNRVTTVWYRDPQFADTVYYGYTPQPYITQVAQHSVEVDTGAETEVRTALAIELYNPHDRAVSLTDLVVTLDEDETLAAGPAGTVYEFTAPTFVAARSFVVLVVRSSPEVTVFDAVADETIESTLDTAGKRVQLWRELAGAPHPYCLLDMMQVTGSQPEALDTPKFSTSFRDTKSESYFAPAGVLPPARWRVTTARPSGGFDVDSDPAGMTLEMILNSLGEPGPNVVDELGADVLGLDGLPVRFGPTAPLYTMNGGLGLVTINGVARPASFPTVGFLMYVPRYTHAYRLSATSQTDRTWRSMSQALAEAYRRKQGVAGGLAAVPADFGHMPVLDNMPPRVANSVFTAADKLPWGLLVFDYFTTVDPDSGDPYAIPGRINVNTAPWYVLAGLPLVNPVELAAAGGSPAFTSTDYGIVFGPSTSRSIFTTVVHAPADHPKQYPHAWQTGGGNYILRLGDFLAQAAAAYRDRIAYTPSSSAPNVAGKNPYTDAELRNAASPPNGVVSYRSSLYDAMRGQGDTRVRGFLTLGELLNVKGFDQTQFNPANGQPVTGVSVADQRDFMKAVSLLAFLDTHYLTTRSNTLTAHVAMLDREQPDASVRSLLTIDRSNLLPRLMLLPEAGTGLVRRPRIENVSATGVDLEPVVLQESGLPRVLSSVQSSYMSATFDD